MPDAVNPAGRDLLRALYSTLRTVGHRPAGSTEAVRWVERTRAALQPFVTQQSTFRLRAVRSQLYFGGDPAPNDIAAFVYHEHVLVTLREAGIGVVELRALPEARELETFLRLLERISSPEPHPGKSERLAREMAARGVRSIAVAPTASSSQELGPGLSKEAAKRTYRESIEVSRELFTGTRLGRSANVVQLRQAIQGIVEGVLSDEASLGGLSALKTHDDYLFAHAVNVCIFCVAIGRRLGLSKAQLYDLGHAALVHDLGMSRIPREILIKPTTLTPDERRLMEAHTWLGALSVFDLRDYGEIPLHSMITAYEHHLRPDGTGYPDERRPREPTIFSKIIAVAAAFDAATNERAYQKARPADEVMLELWGDESRGFDPVVVKALINLLGIYPVGTCVILDSYELALVHSANSDAAFVHRPIVRLLSDAEGRWLEPAPLVDLADRDDAGHFQRTIIKVTSPDRYGIDVSRYLG